MDEANNRQLAVAGRGPTSSMSGEDGTDKPVKSRGARATLTDDEELQRKRLFDVINAMPHEDRGSLYQSRTNNDIITTVISLEPQDDAERMLIYQMIPCHRRAMEALQKAGKGDLPFAIEEEYLKRAERLIALYTKQLAALGKYRSKGQQKVTVEHVQVHSGGQAIVGNVNAGSRAIGSRAANAGQQIEGRDDES